jgi:hypothetical protein
LPINDAKQLTRLYFPRSTGIKIIEVVGDDDDESEDLGSQDSARSGGRDSEDVAEAKRDRKRERDVGVKKHKREAGDPDGVSFCYTNPFRATIDNSSRAQPENTS